jgi:hypothetical protein
VRVIKKLRSVWVSTAPSSSAQKLGHPVPLLNLVSEVKSGWPQSAQWQTPGPYCLSSGLHPAPHVVDDPLAAELALWKGVR